MVVLSLFDGMAGAQIALERAGIKVKKYYSSEVDKWAIKVTQHNYPDTIQLGDIRDWKKWDIEKPDLIIGGSPCQGFSYAGKKKGFKDHRSNLFFCFADILNYYNPKYFLLENVPMKIEYRDIISSKLNVQPVLIWSGLASAQNRNRLYWSNIKFDQPNDAKIYWPDVYNKDARLNEKVFVYTKGSYYWLFKDKKRAEKFKEYAPTDWVKFQLIDKSIAKGYSNQRCFGILDRGFSGHRYISCVECERLQTVPDNYTFIPGKEGISKYQRYKMIGNGFTVDVIAHILRQI